MKVELSEYLVSEVAAAAEEAGLDVPETQEEWNEFVSNLVESWLRS